MKNLTEFVLFGDEEADDIIQKISQLLAPAGLRIEDRYVEGLDHHPYAIVQDTALRLLDPKMRDVVLHKAFEIADHWNTQEGVNGQLLDDLVELVTSKVCENGPHFVNMAVGQTNEPSGHYVTTITERHRKDPRWDWPPIGTVVHTCAICGCSTNAADGRKLPSLPLA